LESAGSGLGHVARYLFIKAPCRVGACAGPVLFAIGLR
jgi:hypothetical protein